MSNFSSLWEHTMTDLKGKTEFLGFDTWIKEMKPIKHENNSFYFEASSEIHKKIINERYLNIIKECMFLSSKKINYPFDANFEVLVLTNDELSIINVDDGDRKPIVSKYIRLNPYYSFENFVVGSSNKFAHAASVAVAEAPGMTYNPLFIYGGVGLGKTHLMQATANYVQTHIPEANIVYVTSESFMNELILSIQTNKNKAFRDKYRNVDLLLIDDIQFIAGRESTQEEFFHTFNALYESNKQIIISSDKPPQDIPTLEERLSSRFQWGLLADIQPPDYETRLAILQKKYNSLRTKENFHYEIDEEILSFIAEKSLTNIRQLEGALQKVFAFVRLNKAKIDMYTAEKILKDFFKSDVKIIYPKNIIEIVCNYYDITVEQIKSKVRSRDISYPRQIAMYIMREITDLSLPKIGSVFGGRDHTTVIHAYEKIANEVKNNSDFKMTVNDLINRIKNN
jgi:chromosomal replication initiator protein